MRHRLIITLGVCLWGAVYSGCRTAGGDETGPTLQLSILEAKLVPASSTIALTLQISASKGSVFFDRYYPQYAISLNGLPFRDQGSIRWRHPFRAEDVLSISPETPHQWAYYYAHPDLLLGEVTRIQMRIQRADMNDELVNTLHQLGCDDADQYASTWHGVLKSPVFPVQDIGESRK